MSVLMVINTTGLEYDDRLRKETGSLRALGREVRILALEYANRAARLRVYDGVEATTIQLRSRRWMPQGRGLVIKTLEMYARFLANIIRARPDVVWCHDLEMSGLVPALALLRRVGLIRRIVWDQHELPPDARLASPLYKRAYRWLVGRCDTIVMANRERRDLVRAWLRGDRHPPIEVLENYPDSRFGALAVRELPDDVVAWLDGAPYLLAQGGANPDRHLDSLVAAVMRTQRIKLVVVGPYAAQRVADLERTHGAAFRQKVRLTGPVPQLHLATFIDHAYASVVLYQADSANTRLCAPNRLYQALARGVPVIVGSNPPMAELVKTLGCGIVLRTDGGDVHDLVGGIRRLEAQYRELTHHAATSLAPVWETQQPVVSRIVQAHSSTTYDNSLSPARRERRSNPAPAGSAS